MAKKRSRADRMRDRLDRDPGTQMPGAEEPAYKERPNSSASSAVRNSAVVASGTLVSRVFGFLRMAVTLYVLVKIINDVFQLANNLPNQVYDLFISTAFSAVLVPAIVRVRDSKHKDQFISALFIIAFSGLFVVTLIATVAAPVLVKIMGYSLPTDWYWVCVSMALWCLPQIFFYGAHSLMGQYLNANGRFVAYAWSPVANNIVAIAGLLIFHAIYGSSYGTAQSLAHADNWDWAAVAWLCGPTTLGIVVQAALLWWPIKQCGFRFVFPIQIRGLGLGKTLREGLWAMSIVFVTYLSVWAISNTAVKAFAWGAEHGVELASVTERNAATLYYALPNSVVIMAILNVLFPRIVSAYLEKDFSGVHRLVINYHRYVGAISAFFVVLLATGSLPLAQVLTLVSDYNPKLVAIVLAAMAPGILAMCFVTMNQRILFAEGRAKQVLFATIPIAVVTVAVCGLSIWLLPPYWWTVGASVGNVLGYTTTAFVGHFLVSPQMRTPLSKILPLYVRPILGGFATAAVGLIYLHVVGFYSQGFADLAARGLGLFIIELVVFIVLGTDRKTRTSLVNLIRSTRR